MEVGTSLQVAVGSERQRVWSGIIVIVAAGDLNVGAAGSLTPDA
jgi:hypothetical protein